jgi:AcrR family transcriptional regulator
MNALATVGLRDRKRMETRARLEQAAVALVLRDGLERTTVDAISAMADVSPRTFFNYFDSKDSAILGLSPAEMSDQAVSDHLADSAGRPTIESVVRLLLSVTGAPLSGSAIREDRLEIVRRHPQLLADQLARLTQIAGRVTDAVKTVLKLDPAFADLEASELTAQAELVLAMCMTAIRLSVREWAAAADNEAGEQELEHRATTLVEALLERLT